MPKPPPSAGSDTLYGGVYHTDGFEEEGVVWKEGQELFDLSDGPGSGSMPYSVAVCYDDIFTAGTIFGTTRTAVVWHGDEIQYTLSNGTGHSKPTRCTSSRSTTGCPQTGKGARPNGRAPFSPCSRAAACRPPVTG